MGILEEIARGTKVSPLDIAQAEGKGRRDYLSEQNVQQELQMKALKMEDWLTERDRKTRLRASLEGSGFSTPEETRKSSEIAMGLGEYKTAMEMEQLALKQIPKKDKKYGNMKPIYSNGQMIGYAQKDEKGQLHNFKTLKSITGKESLTKVTKPSRPSKEQIETATDWVKQSESFGEEGWGFGFSSKDNRVLGRTIASRAQKLIVDAKQLNQSISDEEAMDLAAQEIEALGSTIYEETLFGSGKKLKEENIKFNPGMSKVLLDYFGVDRDEGGIETWTEDGYEYRKLPDGTVQRRKI